MTRPKANEKKLPELKAFGDEVRRHRLALGYSQEAFADHSGLDRSYMGGVERGQYNLTLVNVFKIVDALGLPVGEFFTSVDKLRVAATAEK